MKSPIPKGTTFASRFSVVVLVALIVIFVGVGVVMLITNINGSYGSSNVDKDASSDQASAALTQIDAQKVPNNLAANNAVHMTTRNFNVSQSTWKVGDIVWRNGKAYRVGTDGKLHLLGTQDNGHRVGDIVWKNGKAYVVGKDGLLHLLDRKLHAGDIVWKDGKPYIVGADGKLHALHDGQIVSENGVPYMLKDGKLVPLSALGAHAGDIVRVVGKNYMLGKDGKLHPLGRELHDGDGVWSKGGLYVVKNGALVPLANGAPILDDDGRAYHYEDGKLVAYKPCDVVMLGGQKMLIGQDGKAHAFHDGELCTFAGQTIQIQGNKVIQLSKDEARKAQQYKHLFVVDMRKANDAAMKAPLVIVHGDSFDNKVREQKQESLHQAMLDEQKSIRDAVAHANAGNSYAMQNGQAAKSAFLSANANQSDLTLKSRESSGAYRYALAVGSISPATLITGINSDFPGLITAQVSANVYDTRTGHYLLIPQGTKVFGVYDSQVTYGQSRVLMAWKQLEFPNGKTFDLEGMPGADLAGYSGLHDQVNNHYFRIFGSALLFSVFGAASQLSQPNNTNSSGPTNQQIIYGAIGQQMTQVASNMVEQNMNIQPTINIRPADNFNILVSRQMVFDGPYQFD